MSKLYINFNGSLLPANQPVFTIDNRGFRYGDGLFESMRWLNGELKFGGLHAERISKGMHLLKLETSDQFSEDFLSGRAAELVAKCKAGANARLRLTVYRDAGGLYAPGSNRAAFVLECLPVKETTYAFNNQGLIVDVFDEMTKPPGPLSNLKTCNSLLFVMAGIFKVQNGLDEVLILNSHGFLCESMSSNVFVVYDRKIYTPALTEGCIGGVMRQVIIRLALENNLDLIEAQINPDILIQADEVFLTNAARGVQWVMGFGSKRYFNKVSKFLHTKLNEQ